MDRIVSGDSDGGSFIKFSPLWRHDPWFVGGHLFDDWNFFVLWWNALTFLVPLSVIGVYYLDVKQRKFYFCVSLIFVMANVIMFQPWDKDNTKLFAIWVFLAAGVATNCLSKWGNKNFLLKALVCMVFIPMILSGTIMCVREANLWWLYGGTEEYKVANLVKARTPHDSIFITSDSHINPITNLAGRTTVFGFAGWVHSHGYPNMWARQQELKNFLAHPGDHIKFLRDYNISYICWDMELSQEYVVNQDFLDKNPNVLVLYQSYKYKVYDVTGLREQNSVN